jgi:hypothetical protein
MNGRNILNKLMITIFKKFQVYLDAMAGLLQCNGVQSGVLRLRKMIESRHPGDEEVLSKLIKRVKEMNNESLIS